MLPEWNEKMDRAVWSVNEETIVRLWVFERSSSFLVRVFLGNIELALKATTILKEKILTLAETGYEVRGAPCPSWVLRKAGNFNCAKHDLPQIISAWLEGLDSAPSG